MVNFNSHAHVERDNRHDMPLLQSWISTHTLTWSVTPLWHCVFAVPAISTHTLTWSVTLCICVNTYSIKISTHTLTWSVTLYRDIILILTIFQLTRSRGAWQKSFKYIYNSSNFNSHAHVERDGLRVRVEKIGANFNSHAHVERENSTFAVATLQPISTHTLTWSVTSHVLPYT